MSYRLEQPRLLKAGTLLQAWVVRQFRKTILTIPTRMRRALGDQTYDEMMVGFFDVAVPANIDKTQFLCAPACLWRNASAPLETEFCSLGDSACKPSVWPLSAFPGHTFDGI